MQPHIISCYERKVVYLENVGPFSTCGKKFDELKNLTKDLFTPLEVIGINNCDIRKTKEENYSFLCGFVVDPSFDTSKLQAPLRVKVVPYGQYCSLRYVGPYSGCGDSYKQLFKFVYSHGFRHVGMPVEVYQNDPHEVSQAELVTDLQVQVVKNPMSKLLILGVVGIALAAIFKLFS